MSPRRRGERVLIGCTGQAIARAALGAVVVAFAACDKPAPGTGAGSAAASRVILYSSADADVVRPVIAAFTKETGIGVSFVGDTEVTKTTGLVERLRAEKDHPRADVWWSSEPLGTIALARQGILSAYASAAAEASIPGGWPASMRGAADGSAGPMWYGFAQRARVVVYNTQHVKPEQAPRNLAALADPYFKGRVGIARPQFGTTRAHVAAIVAVLGEGPLRDWLTALKHNDVRLYDGNMSVVRAVANGEIHVGLADTDDVWAGQRNGWPVDLAYERVGPRPYEASAGAGLGTLVLPNTVGLVKGGPNAEGARRLIDFLLSPAVERMLAESDSHNIPVHPDLAAQFARYAVPQPAKVDMERLADAADAAMKICQEVLGP